MKIYTIICPFTFLRVCVIDLLPMKRYVANIFLNEKSNSTFRNKGITNVYPRYIFYKILSTKRKWINGTQQVRSNLV